MAKKQATAVGPSPGTRAAPWERRVWRQKWAPWGWAQKHACSCPWISVSARVAGHRSLWLAQDLQGLARRGHRAHFCCPLGCHGEVQGTSWSKSKRPWDRAPPSKQRTCDTWLSPPPAGGDVPHLKEGARASREENSRLPLSTAKQHQLDLSFRERLWEEGC